MRYFCLDTSSARSKIALGEDGRILAGQTLPEGDHAQNLLDGIDRLFKSLSIDLPSIDAYAVVNGPGSFTGLRIGLSTLKGFAVVHPRPVVALNALEILSQIAPATSKTVIPCVHSRKGKVYAGAFRSGTREALSPSTECEPKELLAKHPDATFIGPALAHAPALFEGLSIDPGLVEWTPEHLCALAWERYSRGETRDAGELEPDYVVTAVASMYKPGP